MGKLVFGSRIWFIGQRYWRVWWRKHAEHKSYWGISIKNLQVLRRKVEQSMVEVRDSLDTISIIAKYCYRIKPLWIASVLLLVDQRAVMAWSINIWRVLGFDLAQLRLRVWIECWGLLCINHDLSTFIQASCWTPPHRPSHPTTLYQELETEERTSITFRLFSRLIQSYAI